ncbi:MAG: MFS transporter, partial [Actinobacteria bacterium]|nr:MFS transporter [Actinomycetota bacterium]
VGALMLREHRERSESPFDLQGFVLSGAFLASLLYTLSEGPTSGWGSPTIATTAIVSLAASAALVWWERRIEHPMLDIRLLQQRLFGLANLTQVFSYASFLGLLFLIALCLQQARGLTPLETGLTVFPEALGVVVSAQVVGRIYPYIGPRRVLALGLTAGSVTLAAFATIDADTSLWTIRLMMFAAGAAVACSFVALQVGTFAAISPADSGRASAIFTTFGHAGSAIGVALAATVLTSRLPRGGGGPNAETFRAFHTGFRVLALVALAGSVVAWFIRDEDAASTLRTRAPRAVEVEAVS